jgi:hypothetical protein
MYSRLRNRRETRGQAVVEMAIILPLLILLLVMAIDAGRLFFGWVALHNASRIGADYAAVHADAWDGAPSPLEQNQRDRYALLVSGDLQALGCQGNAVPDPTFPQGFADGAIVGVELDCDFHPLTPLAESFLGQPLVLHARSEFAVNRTIVGNLPPPGQPPPALGCDPGEAKVPDLVTERNIAAFGLWQGAGFIGPYQPAAQGPNRNRRVATQSLADDTCQPLNAPMLVTLQ